MRITDVLTNCECGWTGTVGDCEPDIDGDGGLGCPKCFSILNVLGPPKPRQEMGVNKITFKTKAFHSAGDVLAQVRRSNIFVPRVGDFVGLQRNEKSLSFGWEVVWRKFIYNIDTGEIEVVIWVKQE